MQSLGIGVDLWAAHPVTIPALCYTYTGALGVAQVMLPALHLLPVRLPLPPEQGGADPVGPCIPKLHSLFNDHGQAKPGDFDPSCRAAATILDLTPERRSPSLPLWQARSGLRQRSGSPPVAEPGNLN